VERGLVRSLEGFPTAPHDDDADAISRAFAAHQSRLASAGFLAMAREDLSQHALTPPEES